MELGQRRANLKEQFAQPEGRHQIGLRMPTRALLGMRNILLTNTKGTLVMNSLVKGYQPQGAALQQLRNGVLISFETGVTTPYALQNAEARGTTYIGPAEKSMPARYRPEYPPGRHGNQCLQGQASDEYALIQLRRRRTADSASHLQPRTMPGLHRK
jgi:GTP-binding protein